MSTRKECKAFLYEGGYEVPKLIKWEPLKRAIKLNKEGRANP